MPSMVMGFVAGSGFTPLVSGNPWSGQLEPVGGIQFYAAPTNSGAIYLSLSGGNFFSGQAGQLVTSGGPTINSGSMYLSGGAYSGNMDGFPIFPGGGFFVPKLGLTNTGPTSGTIGLCVGCDTACSGLGRLYWITF